MDADESHEHGLTDRRFGTLLFMLRMGGIAINMRPQARAHVVYNVYAVSSFYITFCSVFMDYLHKKDNLEESMKNVRILFGMALVSWIHFSFR
jgi:hypothetical protein